MPVLPQSPFPEHEHAVSLGAARPLVMQPHSPISWTAKVRLQEAKPRRPLSPLEQGLPLCALVPATPGGITRTTCASAPTPYLAHGGRSTHFC